MSIAYDWLNHLTQRMIERKDPLVHSCMSTVVKLGTDILEHCGEKSLE
jgi:hypothetical protein